LVTEEKETSLMQRAERARQQDPRSVPWRVSGETDVVAIDTTWGELQPLQLAPDVLTVGELEVVALVEQGALLVDSRTSGSLGGLTLPGSVNIPHDEAVARRGELDDTGISVIFCNGPQCPQSPKAIRELLDAGFPAAALAYYRGGLHDWVSTAMPTEDIPG